MTRRGRLALGLGAATYVVAWAFGSFALYPVAVGLVLAPLLGRIWVGPAGAAVRLFRRVGEGEHLEGDDVAVDVRLELGARVPPGSVVLSERVGKLGERTTVLTHGRGGASTARYVLRSLPRGRYAFEDVRAVIEDPFGLQRREALLPPSGALLVYPRLVEIERLFSEGGLRGQDGRRLLLRRPSGFDLHSVREYEQGESLRRVHWRATAKRGQLMVKELEDAPRDEAAVVLDADAAGVVGAPPHSSFDLAVRAAGSILRAHTRRGRRAVLIVNSAGRELQRVDSPDGDWRRALDVLATVEPTGRTPLAAFLADEASPAARALELAIVTSILPPALVERLLARTLARSTVSLVLVDAASFNGTAGEVPRRDPALLRLQAAGVAVAVVRAHDDLAAVLGDPGTAARAGHA